MEWTTSFYDINLRSAFRCLAFKGVSDHRQLCAAGWEAWPATCKPLAEACRWGRTRTAKRAKPCGCWCHMALHVRDLGSNFKVNAYMSPVFRSVSLDNFVLLLFSSHQKYESKQIHAKPSILLYTNQKGFMKIGNGEYKDTRSPKGRCQKKKTWFHGNIPPSLSTEI